MTDSTAALRATSDALMRDLEVLETLEAQKRHLEPADPLVHDLSTRIEEVAQRLLASSTHQVELTAQVGDKAEAATMPSIEETPRSMSSVLAEWRDAERALAEAAPGSPEELEASKRVEVARVEYRRAFDAARLQQPKTGLD